MRRSLLLGVLAGAAALLLVGTSPAVAPTRNPHKRLDALKQQLVTPSGKVNIGVALRMFAANIGPIPGVRPPRADRGPLGDVTYLIAALLHDSAQLPRKQRTALRHDIHTALGLGSVAGRRSKRHAHTGSARGKSTARLHAPHARAAWNASGFECQLCTPQIRSTFAANVETIVDYYEGATGIPMRLRISYRDQPDANNWVSTNGLDSSGEVHTSNAVVTCRITGLHSIIYYTQLAHELFHCFQLQSLGSSLAAEEAVLAHQWVIEGGAAFAGCMAGRSAPADPRNSYPEAFEGYLNTPAQPLFTRRGSGGGASAYSAMGFFSLIQQDGVNELPAALNAATASSDEAAYRDALGGQEERVLQSWASSYFGEPPRGADWTLQTDPCFRAGTAVPPTLLTVSERPQTLSAAPYAVADYEVQNSATDVMRVQGAGHVRVEGRGVDDHAVQDGYYCTVEGGCSCPAGEEYGGPPIVDLPQTPTPALAITGGPGGSSAMVTGIMYKTLCKPEPLSGHSCVDLLPGFSNELSEGTRQIFEGVSEKAVPIETRTPTYFSSACFFQAKGTTVINGKGQHVFRGVIAVSVSVESWSTLEPAITKMHQYQLAGYAPAPGIGDEAVFHNGTVETSAEGEAECASEGAVRVGDTIGQFSIGGVASEACGSAALTLLSEVAGEL